MAKRKAVKASKVFTPEEREAMKNRADEVRAAADEADGESAVLAKLAEMPASDRALGERLHAIVRSSAPDLTPRLWYGMPAYAKKGKVICHFQAAQKFKTRYATIGFSDGAKLDEGAVWPVAYAITKLTATEEAMIRALVKRAAS